MTTRDNVLTWSVLKTFDDLNNIEENIQRTKLAMVCMLTSLAAYLYILLLFNTCERITASKLVSELIAHQKWLTHNLSRCTSYLINRIIRSWFEKLKILYIHLWTVVWLFQWYEPIINNVNHCLVSNPQNPRAKVKKSTGRVKDNDFVSHQLFICQDSHMIMYMLSSQFTWRTFID